MDPGWARTMENIYKTTGKSIMESMTDELYNDESLRFNWADNIFLERWWYETTDDMRHKFMTIVERK
jgi:hypothetical protein